MPFLNGHVPTDLRDRFCGIVGGSEIDWISPDMSFSQIVEALDGCSDIMPSQVCPDLFLPPGTTYGEGVADLNDCVRRRVSDDDFRPHRILADVLNLLSEDKRQPRD